jgi:hypothetical protein
MANGNQAQGMFVPSLSQYRTPPYSGVQPLPYQAFDLSSILGGGQGAALINMLLQPLLAQLMQSVGMVPGQFQPTMNMYDRMQAQQFFQQQQQAMSMASAADRAQQDRMLRGAFTSIYGPIGPQQEEFFRQFTGQWQQFAPILAQMAPDWYDAIHGRRGSAVSMAPNVGLGSRYLIDPTTGRYGWSGATAGRMTNQIYEELYGEGADVNRMNGLGSLRAGQMFNEMAVRGLIGSSNDPRQIAEKMRNMSEAVSAMIDIFGPNAPMPKIMATLDQITQGGLATMTQSQMANTVRMFNNLARSSGRGLEVATQLMGRGGQLAMAAGLEAQAGVSATLESLAFDQAFKAVGGADVPAWGRMDASSMMMMDQQLRINAKASPMANLLGAAARMTAEGMARPGSDLHRMMEAVRKGQTTFTTNDGREVNIAQLAADPQAFIEMAGQAGIGASAAQQILAGTRANQEYVNNPQMGIGGFVRKQQGAADIEPLLNTAATMALAPALAERGFGEEEIAAMMPRLSEVITRTLREMPPADRDNPARRNQLLAQALRAEMGEEAFQRLGPDDESRVAVLMQIAGATIGNIDEMIARNPALAGYKNHRNLLDLHNQRTQAAADAALAENQERTDRQKAMAPIGRAGPTARIADIIAGKPRSFVEGIMEGIAGGIPEDEINQAMGGDAQGMPEAPPGGPKKADTDKETDKKAVDENRITIAGTLTVKQDGSAELEGTGHRGAAQPPSRN